MENRKDTRSSPRKAKKSLKSTRQERGPSVNLPVKTEHRVIRERRRHTGCCYNTERCKGIGAVLITLGIPASIAGIILTVVAATDDEKENKYPKSFLAIGPTLLVLAVIFVLVGICLYSTYVSDAIYQCFSLDEPTSFCRVRCKKLSQYLKPDEGIMINQIAMKALQSEPGKPVLKRAKPPSVTSEEDRNDDNPTISLKARSRGVRFSESDLDEDVHINKPRRYSASESGSILSLRNCKIVPKSEPDNIWWTDEVSIKEVQNNVSKSDTTEL